MVPQKWFNMLPGSILAGQNRRMMKQISLYAKSTKLDVIYMADPKPNMAADCCAEAAHAPHNRKVFVSAAPPISFNFVSFYTAKSELTLGASSQSEMQSGIPVRSQDRSWSPPPSLSHSAGARLKPRVICL